MNTIPRSRRFLLGSLMAACVATLPAAAQPQKSANELRALVQAMKNDDRGPFQAIRWFCPDGTILPANQRCAQPGGMQHGLAKDIVAELAREQGIYLGQVLAGTGFDDFLDTDRQNSRAKQYQLAQYLQNVDDGWIFRRARYYRGAVQIEDEEIWGRKFLSWLAAKDQVVLSQYFLLRQLCKVIPHQANDDKLAGIRALAKSIADSLPAFIDLRVKIHGQPDAGDVRRVQDFRARSRSKLTPQLDARLENLAAALEAHYHENAGPILAAYLRKLPPRSPLAGPLRSLMQTMNTTTTAPASQQGTAQERATTAADLLMQIRQLLPATPATRERLLLLDLSVQLESLLLRESAGWQPGTVGDWLERNYQLARAAAGCGFLEMWELQAVEGRLRPDTDDASLSYEQFVERAAYARRVVEWGAGMVRATYEPVIALYSPFEPLANGFSDDIIRSSVLLPLGEGAAALANFTAGLTPSANFVMGIANQNDVRGLNAGYALGELRVIAGAPEGEEFAADKIYALMRAPADLKPVAGIATVSEGNLVSHVQLLARNLGLPNASLSRESLLQLQPFSGQVVFYAVSPGGTVVMKPAAQMTPQERALVETRSRKEERILVPTNKINLRHAEVISLKEVRATDSGRLCGPKAANLGQLKSLFPDMVVEGLVLPFGIFRQHLDQQMPDSALTYWQFLQRIFASAAEQRRRGVTDAEVDAAILQGLSQLRGQIKTMPLLPAFLGQLQQRFQQEFGVPIGRLPVFIRSDTNMEDLKDFTGAGLNLTVFNVLDENKIYQAIRDVWASPYTERSYRWRQKYLLNPENVYPSILILPTVNVEKSGVMITAGVSSGHANDITVAFSRGAGGAVEGQTAESYLLRYDGQDLLLSPSRETQYTLLPATGGVAKGYALFNLPILRADELGQLRNMAEEIKEVLPGTPGIEGNGPFDIELGFKDNAIWLFQVRPYVENKRARSSAYLQSLDPPGAKVERISLNTALSSGSD